VWLEQEGRVVERLEPGADGNKFDYASVPLSVAKFLRGQADRIRRQCVTSIVQIGKALSESKRHLSHGAFLQWLECEVGIPARTAQAHMRVAQWAAGKSATVAHLGPSVLYLLSAQSTPEEFTAKILARCESGEQITPTAVRRELKAMRVARDLSAEADRTFGPARVQQADIEECSAIYELVAILVRALSTAEFERVREIATDEAVLSDPDLPIHIQRAFGRKGFSSIAAYYGTHEPCEHVAV
jgi:hypothetical protein